MPKQYQWDANIRLTNVREGEKKRVTYRTSEESNNRIKGLVAERSVRISHFGIHFSDTFPFHNIIIRVIEDTAVTSGRI